jgi:peptide chain release factor 2
MNYRDESIRSTPGWTRCGGIFDAANREAALAALDMESAAPDFWNNAERARSVIEQTNEHKAILSPIGRVARILEDATLMLELLAEEDQTDRALADLSGELDEAERHLDALEMRSLLNGQLDANNAFLTIHAGAGGTESCDWASMLLRMYSRYAQEQGFGFAILEIQSGDEAGIKRVAAQFTGTNAYGYLKAERGVHRLVRISPFDANKRRHTSFAAVDVVAELNDDIEVEINEGDLRVDTYRSSGAGGQHVNTTDSAVRLTHLPTGIVVYCQAERSQHMNREKAMNMLRAKLYEMKMDEQRKDMEKFYGAKGEIAWGSQIRSYVLQPYTMVKDHRTDAETSNVQKVLDGGIQMFIEAWLKNKAAEG